MARFLLFQVIFVAVMQVAAGRSPDEVPGSPIPPLPESARGNESYQTATSGGELSALVPHLSTIESEPSLRAYDYGNVYIPSDAVESSDVWTSTEMHKACEHVIDFSRRSAMTTTAEGQKFVTRLSELSVDDMRKWLECYQSRQAYLSFQREVDEVARQLMLEHALGQQDAMRQAAENVSKLRSEAMEAARENQLLSDGPAALRRLQRQSAISSQLVQQFNPFEAVFDPSSPTGYSRKVAGAMSLPGDLPRGDPANFSEPGASAPSVPAPVAPAAPGAATPLGAAPAATVAPAPAAPAAVAPAGQ
jgi:hypothetical protein